MLCLAFYSVPFQPSPLLCAFVMYVLPFLHKLLAANVCTHNRLTVFITQSNRASIAKPGSKQHVAKLWQLIICSWKKCKRLIAAWKLGVLSMLQGNTDAMLLLPLILKFNATYVLPHESRIGRTLVGKASCITRQVGTPVYFRLCSKIWGA